MINVSVLSGIILLKCFTFLRLWAPSYKKVVSRCIITWWIWATLEDSVDSCTWIAWSDVWPSFPLINWSSHICSPSAPSASWKCWGLLQANRETWDNRAILTYPLINQLTIIKKHHRQLAPPEWIALEAQIWRAICNHLELYVPKARS